MGWWAGVLQGGAVCGPASPVAGRWRRIASTACIACSTRSPAPSTSIHAVSSCAQSSPRAAMLSSPPPSSQATLESSCSESSQMCPPTAGTQGLHQLEAGGGAAHAGQGCLVSVCPRRGAQASIPHGLAPVYTSSSLFPCPSLSWAWLATMAHTCTTLYSLQRTVTDLIWSSHPP
jgi:hypothetical protein